MAVGTLGASLPKESHVSLRLLVTLAITASALPLAATPTLQRTAGGGFRTINPITGSEDFPVFTKEIPGLFYLLGVSPKGADPKTQPANHSPLFFADEAALPSGVRSMANLAVDYLRSGGMKSANVQ